MQKIWGGKKLKEQLNKPFDSDNIGESWEISGIKDAVSVVANGSLKGKTLPDLISNHPVAMMGEKVHKAFQFEFPLLIKFIDATQDLSVQLHPNDALAAKRHQSFGKTEMWYILDTEPDSRLILGFNKEVNQASYTQALTNGTLPNILNEVPVAPGDTFFIPTGTVHAIGSGILLAEIQQTSDITYRIYDWDRVDEKGQSRELHQEEAIQAINYAYKGEKVSYNSVVNSSVNMVNCPYFTTNMLVVTGEKSISLPQSSFTIYMCVAGAATLSGDNFEETLVLGETVLVPAAIKNIKIAADHVKLLEVFISSN